jgi:hydroxymethylpyrimidine pyrophosphatase-like HAD family hydrolase
LNRLPKILAVDFDGTLCVHEFPRIGKPKYEILNKVKRMQKDGWYIILWTCRNGKRLHEAVNWCEEQGLTLDAVNENHPIIKNDLNFNCSNKIFAHWYVDDRNMTLRDFEEY